MNDNKIKNAMRFYFLAAQLKYKIRSGWDNTHWNVSTSRRESVAEHIYDCCILAISLDSEFECNIDLYKVIKMLVIHEIGEVIIGDITPYDGVSPEEKIKMEHDAVIQVVGDLIKKEEIINLQLEFDENKTPEAIFAVHCDKLQAAIQAKVYQDAGYIAPLLNKEGEISEKHCNNVACKYPGIKQMVDDGAQTVFDLWYLSNVPLLKDDNVFLQTLEYIKNLDTQNVVK